MYADKLLKILNKTVDLFEYNSQEDNPPFKIPRKALLILPCFIGDVVLLTPLIRNLYYNFGDNTVFDLVGNKSAFNLVETLPYFNEYHFFNDIKDKSGFLKDEKYDTVFLLNYPVLWAIASYHAGIEQRISFNLERIGLNYPIIWQNLITHIIKTTSVNDKMPQWEVYLNILADLGLNIYDEEPEIRISTIDYYKAKSLLKDIPEPRIAVHITAGSPGKRWNFENWVTILKYLNYKFKCSIIATGTRSEKSIYEFLSQQSGVRIHNLCGKTTIRETIALYSDLDLVITLDTSPAHLAAAANTRNIIIIYGPTNECQWAPYAPHSNVQQIYQDLYCRPCITRFCSHRSCLTKLKVDRVISAIDRILL